jgi:hypothetical protein
VTSSVPDWSTTAPARMDGDAGIVETAKAAAAAILDAAIC